MPKKHEEHMWWKNMDTNIYLDTNIILDLVDRERQHSVGSIKIVRELFAKGAEFYINSDTLSTSYFILRSRKKVTQQEALEALDYCVTLCNIVSVEKKETVEAIALCSDSTSLYHDYEDALQYLCAKKVGATMILTNDKGFISADIPLKGTQHS